MKKAAIAIGVDKPKGLPPLSAAVSGAKEFAQWAKLQGFDVQLLTDDTGPVTVNAIFDAVSNIDDSYSQIVIYFAGHGVLLTADAEYWILSNSVRNPNDAVNVRGSIELARNSAASHIIFISDACRSRSVDLAELAQITGYVIFPNDPPRRSEPAVDVFYAARPGQAALEAPLAEAGKTYRGIFTECLLKGLRAQTDALWETGNFPPGPWRVISSLKLKYYLESEVPILASDVHIRLSQNPAIHVESHFPPLYFSVVAGEPSESPTPAAPTVSFTLSPIDAQNLLATLAGSMNPAEPAVPSAQPAPAVELALSPTEVQKLQLALVSAINPDNTSVPPAPALVSLRVVDAGDLLVKLVNAIEKPAVPLTPTTPTVLLPLSMVGAQNLVVTLVNALNQPARSGMKKGGMSKGKGGGGEPAMENLADKGFGLGGAWASGALDEPVGNGGVVLSEPVLNAPRFLKSLAGSFGLDHFFAGPVRAPVKPKLQRVSGRGAGVKKAAPKKKVLTKGEGNRVERPGAGPLPTFPSAQAEEERTLGDEIKNLLAATKGPELKIRTGFHIVGQTVVRALFTGGPQHVSIVGDSKGPNQIVVSSVKGGSMLIEFASGMGTCLAVLPGFIGTLVVEEGEVVNVSYDPSEGTPPKIKEEIEKRRSLAAVASRNGYFRIEPEDAPKFAGFMRQLKSFDPTLGLYAAYGYSQSGMRKEIESIYLYMTGDDVPVPFDVALLARKLTGVDGRLDLTRVAPFCPMLTQGWTLLSPVADQIPEVVRDVSKCLYPSLWTVFRPEGVKLLADAIEKGTWR